MNDNAVMILQGIYPTVVVILVHTHCSVIDSQPNSAFSEVQFKSTISDVAIPRSRSELVTGRSRMAESNVRRGVTLKELPLVVLRAGSSRSDLKITDDEERMDEMV